MLFCVCSKRQFQNVSKQDTEAILITIKLKISGKYKGLLSLYLFMNIKRGLPAI